MKTPSDKAPANRDSNGYTPALWLIELTEQVRACESDIKMVISCGKIPLAAQLRAYDLLDALARYQPIGEQIGVLAAKLEKDEYNAVCHNFHKANEAFCMIADSNSALLQKAFSTSELESAAASHLRPWEKQYERVSRRAQEAIELYNAADAAYKSEQNGNLLERWRSLRRVRKMAGFRLERKRIGNYVTKTYELMLDLQKELMAAQQQMHSHNVSYKCEQMLYPKISDILKESC